MVQRTRTQVQIPARRECVCEYSTNPPHKAKSRYALSLQLYVTNRSRKLPECTYSSVHSIGETLCEWNIFFFRVDASGKERATTNCDARRSRSTNFARPNRIVYLHIGDLVSAVWHDVCTRAASKCLLYRIAVARATLQKC